MSDRHDLVDRANQLMRAEGRVLGRRRSFLAAPGQPSAPLTLPPPGFANDELPVLTEVVPADDFASLNQAEVATLSADAARPAGDEDDLVGELHGFGLTHWGKG